MFLSGWLGGPGLYVETFGRPMLRARYLSFAVGIAERDAWLACMLQAMEDVGTEKQRRENPLQGFYVTADRMRSRDR